MRLHITPTPSDPGRERRRDARLAITRPVKVQCVYTGRYYPAVTTNVSAGGAMLSLQHPSLLVAGQRLRLGVAWNNQQTLMPADAMVQATVIRSHGAGRLQDVAIAFDERQELALSA